MTIEEIADTVIRDKIFFDKTGGGVTLSGGEPLYNITDAFIELLEVFKAKNISVAMDTCGYTSPETLLTIAPYTSLFFWDFKIFDSKISQKYTGIPNELIKDNLKLADKFNIPIYICFPLIRGITDSEENIKAVCGFISRLKNFKELRMLPMHHFGKVRYECMSLPYALEDLPLFTDGEIADMARLVESMGVPYLLVR
jgi:pyruvate formate lyase activating enzyme